jgi:hypothetical protein
MNREGLPLSILSSLSAGNNSPMRTLFSVLVIVLGSVALAGCASSTPQDRISQNRSRFESFPSDVQRKISAGQADIGFTEEMVLMALGEPGRKLSRSDQRGQSDVWIYFQRRPHMGFGFGVSSGGYGGVGTGVAVSTQNRPDEEVLRVVFVDHVVSAVETTKTR